MTSESPSLKIVRLVLGLALLASLFLAGRHLYRGLPASGDARPPLAGANGNFQLNIVMRDGLGAGETRIELYPIEYAAVQRSFLMNGRPGRSLEEYLAQQLKALPPVKVQIDQTGHAVARLSAGPWWMRATSAHSNGEIMEWRMPLTISQPVHTIELSGDNAYERTRKF